MLRSPVFLSQHPYRRWLLGVGVPLLFFSITGLLMPIAHAVQFDPDEGIELAKVMLYNQGYRLYDQIWNDQPPLLTLLLAQWLKGFGAHIVAARLLTLCFATLLVGAFYNALALIVGIRAALLGTVGLSLTFGFMRLSVSVMRGLPALALAMVAIYGLVWVSHGRSQQSRFCGGWGTIVVLLLSGFCFGLSLQLKFYTLLVLPACIVHLVMAFWRRPSLPFRVRPWIVPVGLWFIACGLALVLVGWLTHAVNVQQLLGTHFNSSAQVTLQREPSWLLLLMFLGQDLDYSLLAGVGILSLLKAWRQFYLQTPHLEKHPPKHPQWPILPLVWLVTVLGVFANYQPLWDHYYPMVAVPVVWLATYALHQPVRRRLTTGLLIFAIALVPIKLTVNGVLNHQIVQESKGQVEVIDQVRAFQHSTRWLFTDLPIVAFYTNLKVPPELAVFSLKRIQSGSLGAPELKRIVQTYQPEQVLLGRYPQLTQMLEPYLGQNYVKHYEKGKIAQYVRRSIEPKNPAPVAR